MGKAGKTFAFLLKKAIEENSWKNKNILKSFPERDGLIKWIRQVMETEDCFDKSKIVKLITSWMDFEEKNVIKMSWDPRWDSRYMELVKKLLIWILRSVLRLGGGVTMAYGAQFAEVNGQPALAPIVTFFLHTDKPFDENTQNEVKEVIKKVLTEAATAA